MTARDDYPTLVGGVLDIDEGEVTAALNEIDRLRHVASTAHGLLDEYHADPDGSAVALLFDVLAESLNP